MSDDTRVCVQCGNPLPEMARKNTKVCSPECRKARDRAYYKWYNDAHKAEHAAYAAAHREEKRAYRESRREENRAYAARWLAEHRDERRAYRAARADETREYLAAWRAANPDKVAEYSRRRVERGAHTITEAQRAATWERDGGVCYLCHEIIPADLSYPDPLSRSLDHVVPVSRGGDNSDDNLRWCHLACNQRKYDRLVSELDWVA